MKVGIYLAGLLFALSLTGIAKADSDGKRIMPTQAAMWRSMSNSEHETYVMAFQEGELKAYDLVTEFWKDNGYFNKQPSEIHVTKIRSKLSLMVKLNKIVGGITALYKDPLNKYIDTSDALCITVNNLKGLDVKEELKEARQLGYSINR